MERSGIRDRSCGVSKRHTSRADWHQRRQTVSDLAGLPDCASLHPGYAVLIVMVVRQAA